MPNRADELQRAAAGAASRRVAQGIPPHDPVTAGEQHSGRPPRVLTTKYLYIIAIVCGLALLSLVLSYLGNVALSHLLLFAVVIVWTTWGFWRKKK
jgi:uncharacterized membrane protein YphA (DoxX/SURF4 family)